MRQRPVVRWFSLTLVLLWTAGAAAAEEPGGWLDEVRLGVLGHDVPFPDAHGWETPDPFGHRFEGGANLNPELLLHRLDGWSLIGAPQPHVGISVNTAGYTSYVYGGLTWRATFWRHFLAEAYFGLAVHDGELEDGTGEWASLGSRALFRGGGAVGAELGARWRCTLIWEHMSNAGLAEHNDGMDSLGVRVGYRLRPAP